MSDYIAVSGVLVWWLVIEALGLAAFPLAYRLLPGLPDRGYGFAKILGLLLLGYATWLVEMLQFANFSRATVFSFLALLALLSGWLAWKQQAELGRFVRRRWRLMLGYELLFLVALVAFAWFRGFNPEIAGTEKPMDFALLNGILRSHRFPPADPWMSGFSISYYYFGYYLVAVLVRLSGVAPAVAFNLGLASTFALAVVGVAALVGNLTRSWSAALLGVFLTLLASNPDGLLRVLSYGTLQPQKFWWWWDSSRVLHSGCRGPCIDEFPQFSFLLGDLHPHLMALPFAALALGLGLAVLLRSEPLRWRHADLPELALLAIGAGALGFLNTWDLPAYLAVVAGCVILRQVVVRPAPSATITPGIRATLAALGHIDWRMPGLVIAAAVAAYLPFYIGFSSQASGFGLVRAQTSALEFARMWGFLALLALLGFVLYARLARFAVVALAALGLLILLATRHWLLAASIPLALAALWSIVLLALSPKWRAERAYVLALLSLAMALLAVCEVVYLKDTFNDRMNTIFKFYYEDWLLFSVAGSAAAHEVTRKLAASGWRWAWRAVVGLLCLAAAVYPAASFYSKAGEFRPAWTLDGSAFMRVSDPSDYAAITWLNNHVRGDAVLAEATGDEYSNFARFGTFTGLESILGWAGHELQWRGAWVQQPVRIADLAQLYTSTNPDEVKNLLRRYNVSYVVVGPLERQKYGNRAFTLFERFGTVAFQDAGTTVYHINSTPSNGPRAFGIASAQHA